MDIGPGDTVECIDDAEPFAFDLMRGALYVVRYVFQDDRSCGRQGCDGHTFGIRTELGMTGYCHARFRPIGGEDERVDRSERRSVPKEREPIFRENAPCER